VKRENEKKNKLVRISNSNFNIKRLPHHFWSSYCFWQEFWLIFFQSWKSIRPFSRWLIVNWIGKILKLILKQVKSLTGLFHRPSHWFDGKQGACWFIFHYFYLLVLMWLKTIFFLHSVFKWFILAPTVPQQLVLLGGGCAMFFLVVGMIFLSEIMNDLKRLISLFKIIECFCSQYHCTDPHEKGFYQNVQNKKLC